MNGDWETIWITLGSGVGLAQLMTFRMSCYEGTRMSLQCLTCSIQIKCIQIQIIMQARLKNIQPIYDVKVEMGWLWGVNCQQTQTLLTFCSGLMVLAVWQTFSSILHQLSDPSFPLSPNQAFILDFCSIGRSLPSDVSQPGSFLDFLLLWPSHRVQESRLFVFGGDLAWRAPRSTLNRRQDCLIAQLFFSYGRSSLPRS